MKATGQLFVANKITYSQKQYDSEDLQKYGYSQLKLVPIMAEY